MVRPRDIVLRVVVCTLLGVALTVGVAWGFTLEQPHHGWPGWRGRRASDGRYVLPQHRYRSEWGDVMVDFIRRPGATVVSMTGRWTRRSVPDSLTTTYPYPEDVPPAQAAVFGNPRSYALPGWAVRPDGAADPQMISTHAWGWPSRALCGVVRAYYNYAPTGEFLGATKVPSWFWVPKNGFLGDRHAMMPLSPIWPGFALDTAFYGTLAFLLWSAPGFVRRTRRRRRGLCVACGYELKGMQKCPECGL